MTCAQVFIKEECNFCSSSLRERKRAEMAAGDLACRSFNQLEVEKIG